MNPKHLLPVALCVLLSGQALAQEMDKELSDLATKLAALTNESGKKKVTVLDFTDLQGGASELGKYVAEELTVNLVMVKTNFAVLDRANLRKILAEHKLTATGLIDPDTAKKLGQFAGVDALILGTIIPKGQKVTLTAKIITTDTAEIVGAAKAEFKSEDTVQQLLSKPAESKADGRADEPKKDEKTIVKSFGDLRVEVQSLKVVNGRDFLLTLTLTNLSPKKSIWAAISTDLNGELKGAVTDSGGQQFQSTGRDISGVSAGTYLKYSYQGEGIQGATEIKPGEALPVTVKFYSRERRSATEGQCNLQLEFLCGSNFRDGFGKGTAHNLITKIAAE